MIQSPSQSSRSTWSLTAGRIADLMAEKKAQLWINHDKPQSLSQERSPVFYD